MQEIWKPVKDYENLYLVSNLGKVKSLDRITRNNHATFIKKGRILKNNINNKGYEYLYLKRGKESKKIYVHRLVAETFIPNPNNKKEVNHIDCNPLNNNVSNLEWVTHKENMGYMAKLGRSNKNRVWLNKIIQSNSKHWKSVVQINKITGKIIKIYPNLNSVKQEGYRASDVCNCCKGRRYTAGGYIWRYANDRHS